MHSEVEEGLRLVDEPDAEDEPRDDDAGSEGQVVDGELESLRAEFVAAFNARDLDAVLALVADEVECPDRRTAGAAALTEELSAIWDRSPGVILTDALLDGAPCAVAWLPDEDGCWYRAALVCLDAEGGLLQLVELPDDADALERAETDDPTGEELEQGTVWPEWDAGEEALSVARR
jgi:hypothetical protein